MNIIKGSTKGFTLLELIIVIGIIAILGTVSVLALNPGQLFAQARDTTRISDLATIHNALSLYLTDVASPNFSGGTGFTCGTNFGASVAGATEAFTGVQTLAHAGVRTVAGEGWVAVNLSVMTGGSPIATLPIDPTNNPTYNYQYACNNTTKTFELDANLESDKYKDGGTSDKETTDGGDQNTGATALYEVGSSLVL